jgi:hypothetical protein
MSGLKRYEPALRFGGFGTQPPVGQVTPDEIDRYEVLTINPSGAVTTFIGTAAVAGTSGTSAVVLTSILPDWPRNVEFAIAGSAAGMAGTLTLNGVDQFGSVVQEVIALGTASNGGTTAGTKVFAQFSSGTIVYGTAVGGGTPRIGLGTTGTTALLGLPFKVGGTTDLKILAWNVGTGAVAINGGTIAAFINVPFSAIKSPFNIAVGTNQVTAWVKPTFNAENLGIVANLPQRT